MSIYRVLIYTFQMGDYRTVVKQWSITHTLLHPSAPATPLMEIPLVLAVNITSVLTNKQKHKGNLSVLKRYGANNETHFYYLSQTLYLEQI